MLTFSLSQQELFRFMSLANPLLAKVKYFPDLQGITFDLCQGTLTLTAYAIGEKVTWSSIIPAVSNIQVTIPSTIINSVVRTKGKRTDSVFFDLENNWLGIKNYAAVEFEPMNLIK